MKFLVLVACGLALFSSSCATFNYSSKVMDNLFYTGTSKKSIKKFKNEILDRLKDPDSAKFRKLTWKTPIDKHGNKIVVLCGEVNAKNAMGGYTGYSKFFSNGSDGLIADSDSGNWTFKMIRCACTNGNLPWSCWRYNPNTFE